MQINLAKINLLRYANYGKIIIKSSCGIHKTEYHNANFYCHLERENWKVLKFHVNDYCCFE